jgi:large subunit ribosomal protein L27Ae
MRKFRLQRNRDYTNYINLDRLWTLVSEQTRLKYETAKAKDKAPVIDVTKAGFFKVLGRGRLPNIPVVVKARFFSKVAERRIRAIGGACVLTA